MSSCLYKTGILSVVLTAAVCYGAPLRKWTNTEGKSFSGTIVDCDGETAKYKVFGRNKLVEIPLSQLCSADRRIAVIEAYKPKYEAALRHLKSEAAKTSKDVFLNREHIPYLNDIGMYLKEIVKPVAEKFKPEGEFDESDDYWVRVHSGMVYFATTWLEELSNQGEMLKTGEARPPKLKDTLRHIGDFYEFFAETHAGKNYFKSRLGRQFPVKFKPKNYIHDNQPYHYWVYLPQKYDKEPLPLVFFLCGIGEFGTSLDAVLTNDLPKLLETRKDYPFVVISPQDNDRVSRPPYFNEILADAKRRFKIDEDRIIGTGLSSGGTGIWRWALNNPDVFAGIVPVCAVMPLEEIKQLKDMPVWIFNNEYDKVWIQEIAIANMRGNPNFKYTIFAGAKGHDAWSKAYSVKGLEEWMSKLDRKNNVDNTSSVLAQYKTENKLTPPQVKVEKGQNYLMLAFDPTAKNGKYAAILNAHSSRYGSLHDSYLYDALSAIYQFQHFEMKQPATPRPVRFINVKKPDEYTFAIPIKNFQKVDIKPPFEVRDLPSYKCYSAYFVSETEEPSAAFNRLRRMATEAGYSLTGQDRIVYLQMLFSDRNIYELQLGIR